MRKLGIIGAMEEEVALLQEKLERPAVTRRAGMEFWDGVLCGLPVTVVQSGIGKVNAALCVQVLADLYGVTHAMYHDIFTGPLGDSRGQVPGMDVKAFPADPELVALTQGACEVLKIPYRVGRIVSGDQFVWERTVKEDILHACGGICVEMEGAAIAHAAYRNRLPVVILRAISDKADDAATVDYQAFEDMAARNSARLTEALAAVMAEISE